MSAGVAAVPAGAPAGGADCAIATDNNNAETISPAKCLLEKEKFTMRMTASSIPKNRMTCHSILVN
jgi:hypothetical protein